MTPKICFFISILILFTTKPNNAQIYKDKSISGPIRIRNNFPATLPFLGFSAESAWPQSLHKLSVSIDYIRSNTFVKSGNIVQTLQRHEGRNVLTGGIVYRILAGMPQDDAFLLDTEVRTWRIHVSYGLSNTVTLDAEVPIIQFGGGIFDRFIERFHRTFGLPDDKRPLFVRNTSETLLYFDGQFLFREPGRLKGAGFGDFVFSAKFNFVHSRRFFPDITVQIAIKAPTGSYRKLRGSGSFDYGLNLISSKKMKKNVLHLNAGVVWPGKWKALPHLQLAPIYSTLIGYERLMGRYTSFVVQHLLTTSIFRKATDTGIADDSYEFTFGVKFGKPENFRWTISVTENHVNFNSSPDIGFHLGVERRF